MARFTGTRNSDSYVLKTGRRELVWMDGGDDSVHFSADALGTEDRIRGGTGVDRAYFENGGTYTIGDGQLREFEFLVFRGKGAFDVTLDNSVAAPGSTLSVVVSTSILEEEHPSSLILDASAERNASLIVRGSVGNDRIVAGGGDDRLYGETGDDVLGGGKGSDSFYFIGHSQKGDIWGDDVITDFTPDRDQLVFQSYAADAFEDLSITDTDSGVLIRTAGSESSVLLAGVHSADLHPADFTFLGVHG